MKSKRNKLIIGGVAGIVAMFLLSLFLPAFQPFAKAGALVIYALVNYVQIKEMKRNGQDIEKDVYKRQGKEMPIDYMKEILDIKF